MQAILRIKNYRCFPTGNPLELEIGQGFSAFVGINNAGKSSALKLFYDLRSLFSLFGSAAHVQQLTQGGAAAFQPVPNVGDLEGIFSNGNSEGIQIEGEITDPPPATAGHASIVKVTIEIPRGQNHFTAVFSNPAGPIARQPIVRWVEDTAFSPSSTVIGDFGSLRGVFKTLSNSFYVPSFRHITPFTPVEGAPSTYYDLNVGRPFIDMWHGMQTGNSRSDRGRIYQLIEDVRTIFGFRELQITDSLNKQTLQLIIDGKPYDLHDLGSGLAQFILVLASVAFRKPSLILIDEPELNLHPSLQVKFLMRLGEHASNGVFFATHNIGLARSVADRIYSVVVTQSGSAVTSIDQTPRLAELLGELNYEGYRPLGFNKLLLVEGRTSFKLFIEFLRTLNKDHEFLVVPMSDLITQNSREELQEVTRICPRVFAVIDSERQNAGAALESHRQAFDQNCRDLGIRCHVSERRAIENYLSDRAIKAEMGPGYRALGPYEGRQGLNLWHKKDNWKIAHRMNRAEIEATDIGQFLAAI